MKAKPKKPPSRKTAAPKKGRPSAYKTKQTPKKKGRPTKYTAKLVEKICCRIADGKSLRKVCEDPKMPNRDTVLCWLGEHEEFHGQYARAREVQADTFAGEIVEIADTEENAQKARNRIDARKWSASKLRPKVYGDRVTQEHSGSINVTVIERVIVDSED